MGGCVVSVMSAMNSAKQVENPEITKVRNAGPQSVEIGEPTTGKPESRIRRSPSMAHLTLAQVYDKFADTTLPLVLQEKVREFHSKKAMGIRGIEKTSKEEVEVDGKKKEWEYLHLRETTYLTYGDMWSKMLAFGRGLASLGFGPKTRVGLYEETRYEWLVSCYGLWSQDMIGVTVYANLGEDSLVYAIREAELPVLVMNGKQVKALIALCQKARLVCPKLIVLDDIPAGVDVGAVEVYNWTDVVARGESIRLSGAAAAAPSELNTLPKNPKDLALIMYTSGTTGDPKGVMISHGNALAAVRGLGLRLAQFLTAEPDETYLAYLPLAHILEFAAENVMLGRGAMIGYGTPRTLTDVSAKPHGDLKEFKPLMFAGVPRIFDTIKKAVESELPPDGLKRQVFDRAYDERKEALKKGFDTPYWNDKVFANPRALLGGRVKALLSGGAPLSAQTHEFLSVVFGCSVGQAYGLTETCAATSAQRYYDLQPENAGGLLSVVEMKLRDVDDWKHTDPQPRGEILVRGPTITQGYYKQPEKTAEAFLPDGWFATGDVGMIGTDGTIKIVGRVKALAKNAHGEYIALEALEVTYVLCDLCLPNGVCVLVHPHRPYICAVALTDETKAMAFAKMHNLAGEWPTILQSPEFRAKSTEAFGQVAKKAGRKPFEIVRHVRFLHDEWTPENGVLTAASKLKRRVIDVKYADEIAQLFSSEN